MPNANHNSACLHCGGPIKGGVAYLSAGALWLDDELENSIHDDRHLAFMHVGYHGSRADVLDSADIEVKEDVPGGQFDLSFCSLNCLKLWFVQMVDSLESQVAPYRRGQG
jgi:hypothetical protein